MSTRGTYSFKHNWKGETIFYIHSDNYPEGAAEYFWQMHLNKHLKGCLADVFIKANPLSVELTKNHEYHADTEYRYYMNTNGVLVAKQVDYDVFDNSKFDVFFTGHYAEFINKYCKNADKLYQIDAQIVYQYSSSSAEYMTFCEVKDKLNHYLYNVHANGYKQYEDNLMRWTKEFQRIKDLYYQDMHNHDDEE